jgi:mono/diheme cytochrome c family protein
MGKKRPERTERRARERAMRGLVRDREKLAALSPGGSAERPIEVPSPAVIDTRVGAMRCPQCEGTYAIDDHQAEAGLRVVSVTCRLCHVSRRLWFRLGSSAPS